MIPDLIQNLQIRESCVLAKKILVEIGNFVKPGISTQRIDDLAKELIIIHNAYPSALNFKAFPKSISTSGLCKKFDFSFFILWF